MAIDESMINKSPQWMSERELQQSRYEMAKEANRRIRELRNTKDPYKGHNKTGGRGYLRNADNAYHAYLKGYLPKKKGIFSEARNRKLSTTGLRHEVEVLQKFLSAQTSTVEGIELRRERRAQTMMVQYGISKETAYDSRFYDFLDSKVFEEVTKQYGSSSGPLELMYKDQSGKFSVSEVEDLFKKWIDQPRPSKKNLKEIVDAYSAEQRGGTK